MNEKVFSHEIAKKIINNILATNILPRGYTTKLKNYRNYRGVGHGGSKAKVPFEVRYGYFLELHNIIRCLQHFTDCFSMVPLVMAFYKVPMDISSFYIINTIREDVTWLRRETRFSLQISLTHETLIFQHQKRNFVSPSGHVMFNLLHKHH